MVAFNDRRQSIYDSVDDLVDRVGLQPGDTVSKKVIEGRYFVRGALRDDGKREFVIHEGLPNGTVIERGRFDRRHKATTEASKLPPTRTYDV